MRNTNKISDLAHVKEESIFITKNGYGDLVVMSIKTFDSMLEEIIFSLESMPKRGALRKTIA